MLPLNCYGSEVDQLILKPLKLFSLRKPHPEKYGYSAGDQTIAYCKDSIVKEIPIIIFSAQTRPIEDYLLPVLLLDGYAGPEHAAEDLATYPGYEDVTPQCPMTGLGFIPTAIYELLPKTAQHDLVSLPFDNSVVLPALHQLFLPPLFQWLLWRLNNFSLGVWHDFLIRNNFFTKEFLDVVRNIDEETQSAYEEPSDLNFQEILDTLDDSDTLYRSIVLCEPLSLY